MFDPVTVATFQWPTDAAVPQGLLEHAGIPTFLKDAHTVQVNNMAAQAVGGVKLQVPSDRAAEARAILQEGGFITAEVPEDNTLWAELDHITRQIPLLGRIELLMARLLVLLALVLVVVITPIAISAQPSTAERLSASNWCVERVQVDGREITLNTEGVHLVWDNCPNELRFHPQGTADLPGFKGPVQHGAWRVENELLFLSDLSEPHPAFAGPLSISVNDRQLTLSSPGVRIYCSRLRRW
jgi:hypothetical protein